MPLGIGLLLAATSGVLLILSFPPFSWGGLSLVCLVPFLFARHRMSSPRDRGLVTALPFYLWLQFFLWNLWPGILWLSISPVAVAVVLFFLGRLIPAPRNFTLYPVLLAIFWVLLEWARQFTPLGMAGFEDIALNLEESAKDTLIYDLVYTPRKTGFLRLAEKAGLKAFGGLGMLVFQAIPAFEAWFGVRPEVDANTYAMLSKRIKHKDR